MLSHVAVAALFVLLVSRCQRVREFRDLSLSSCECVLICLVFLSRELFSHHLLLVWFVLVRPGTLSYGVRHMHSSLSYCLSCLIVREPMLSCALHFMLISLPCLHA